MKLLEIGLPILWILVASVCAIMFRGQRWGFVPLMTLPIVNIIMVWLLVAHTTPDYFFWCLIAACLFGITLLILTIVRTYDVLILRFFRQYSCLMALVTTLWWAGALINMG